MGKKGLLFVFFVLVLALAYFTNPSEETQKAIIKQKVSASLEKLVRQNQSGGTLNNFAIELGMAFADKIIQSVTENNITTSNYLFFSIPRLSFNGNTRVIGIAAFGYVYIGDIEKELQKNLGK